MLVTNLDYLAAPSLRHLLFKDHLLINNLRLILALQNINFGSSFEGDFHEVAPFIS